MSVDTVEHRAADLPPDLPTQDSIVQRCAAAGYRQNGTCFEVKGIPRFWIKYGTYITLGEARTQDKVAQICRYIVMEYVTGDTVASRQPSVGKYAEGDLVAVATAVKQLIGLRVSADTPPGYVGGGPIGHDFFLECMSTSEYPTVGDLQAQINKLVAPQRLKVDYSSETAEGLVLCPSDIDPSNFMISREGMVFAIDFGCTGYMPSSYVSYSLANPKPFTRRVARLVNYPKSANLHAMQQAAGQVVISGNNSLGVDTKPVRGKGLDP